MRGAESTALRSRSLCLTKGEGANGGDFDKRRRAEIAFAASRAAATCGGKSRSSPETRGFVVLAVDGRSTSAVVDERVDSRGASFAVGRGGGERGRLASVVVDARALSC